MGLLKAIAGATGGVLADSWRDYFYCESLDQTVLAAKGQKRTSKRSSNKHGEDNIISDGSIVAVNEGQCMIIVESGEVVEFSAEPGQFAYQRSTEPSLFVGDLGEGIQKTFQQIGRRFEFGGDTGNDQRVYYFNTKEIIGNKYGTPSPIPFRVVDRNIGLDVDISVRCNGEYSYRITDPLLFYKNVCGNVEDVYTRDRIDSQLRSELLTALQPAFAKVSEEGIRYSAIPAHTKEVATALNEELSESWTKLRGISIVAFGVNSINASEEDQKRIKDLQSAAVLTNPTMAAANLAAAQGDAMRAAAANEGGAFNGFVGMGMASSAGGANVGQLFEQGAQQQRAAAAAPASAAGGSAAGGWTCPQCGQQNAGKFCSNCGTPRPEAPAGWFCPDCGTKNSGKFCTNCGTPRP